MPGGKRPSLNRIRRTARYATATVAAMSATSVSEAFDLGGSVSDPRPVARGAMGEVFRVDTDRGAFAVKRLFDGPMGDEDANVAFQFAAAAAGVSLATPVLTRAGAVVVRVGGEWWRAYEWIDGHHVPNNGAAPVGAAVSVARNLGRLHALGYDFGPNVDGWFQGVGDDEVFAALDAAERAGVRVDGARRALPGLAAVSRMQATEDPVGCHNDPDRPNVIVAGGAAVLVDWDNAGACYAGGEFAGALWHWAFEGSDDPTRAVAAMTVAYRDSGGVFDEPDLSVFATMCSAWVNYAINCCTNLTDTTITAETLAFERPVVDSLATYAALVDDLQRILAMVPKP